jgi:hypothetical protein
MRILLCAYTHNAPGAGPRTHINILSLAFTHSFIHSFTRTHSPTHPHIGARRLTLLAGPTDGSLFTIAPVLPTWPAPAEIYASECRSLCPRPFYEKKFQTFFAHFRKGPLRHPPIRYTMKNGKRNVKP